MNETKNNLLLSVMLLLYSLGLQQVNNDIGEIIKDYIKNPVFKFVLITCIFYIYSKDWMLSLAGSLFVTNIILYKYKQRICKRIDK